MGDLTGVGRAPIDPNFVLAIERNQQNQMALSTQSNGDNARSKGHVTRTIVHEYTQLALCDVFQEIVSRLVGDIVAEA